MKTGLGKGLSALIDNTEVSNSSGAFLPNLQIDFIVPNPYQPRIDMPPERLIELADSIRENGIVEPLIVTKKSENKYELIAGERRLRAAKLAGLKTVPAVIKEASPQQMLELAIVENVQRQDLNPLEEALAFDQLVKMFGLSHDEVAAKMGMSRPAIANKVRLLTLPEEIRRGLLEGKVSEGHARALLGLNTIETMLAAYKVVVKDSLSVRAVEELVRRLNVGTQKKVLPRRDMRILDAKTSAIEKQLTSKVGWGVNISRSQKGGKVVIPFKNDGELDKLLGLFGV